MADLDAVFARLDAYVERRLRADGTPGMAVALTDRERLLRATGYGFRDLAARAPVTPETLFEIGSIGKSFTAIALLQLHEAGALDLHAPVARYLPWFRVRTVHAPIALHHLLTHTAGIIAGTDATPDARSEVWALREMETGGPPGERFHYSNVGYKALGLVLAELAGRPYPEVIRERIIAPLGMADTAPAITHAIRPRLAVAYGQVADDVPPDPGRALAPATWLETDTADGSVAATAADLATFLRMLLNGGRGPGGPLLSEASFGVLTARAVESGPGEWYGYGLFTEEADGRVRLGHGGGMVGHYAGMVGDREAGLGAVAFVNGPGWPWAVTRYALDLLLAAEEGRALPDPPPEEEAPPDAAAFAGEYRGEGGVLRVVADGGRCRLEVSGEAAPVDLEWRGEDAFAVRHPGWERFRLRFGRDGERAVEAWHGAEWWAGEGHVGPAASDPPPAWRAYPGHYRSHNPWLTNLRVVLRRGRLWLVLPGGDADGFGAEEPLAPLGEPGAGEFRVGADERSPERIRFDWLANGETLRATLSGCDYYRCFTP